MSYVDLVENILAKKEDIKGTKRPIESVDPDESIGSPQVAVPSPGSTTMVLRPRRRPNPSVTTYHVAHL